MQVTVVTFNFKSADLPAEEKNYFDNHVALVRTLPGLRLYLTGKLRETRLLKPDRYRAAIVAFDDPHASRAAMAGETGAKLRADTEAHLSDPHAETAEAEWVVPFDSRKPGQECFAMAALFNFKPADLQKAEEHYRGYHVGVARRLPGLRGYLIGKTVAAGGAKPARRRMVMLTFDSYEALRAAYKSPIGQELAKDEDYLIADPRVYYLDARVEV